MDAWEDGTPIYRQIQRRMEADLLNGTLTEGGLLESVRQVAAALQVNPLTVARAYREMTDAGLVDKERGVGLRVVPGARARLLTKERQRFLTEEWPAISTRIRLLGLDVASLIPK